MTGGVLVLVQVMSEWGASEVDGGGVFPIVLDRTSPR